MMEIASKEKMVTFAMIGLCVVIGVMALLAVVYYGQATGLQNHMNTQTASLESQISDLQAENTQLHSTIGSLTSQKTALETSLATLQSPSCVGGRYRLSANRESQLGDSNNGAQYGDR